MPDVLDAAIDALERGERIALLTLVRSVGSTPRHCAARLAVLANGETVGSVGGGAMEHQAVADAHAALAENRPRLVEYNLNGRGDGSLGLCGGTQEVLIDILEPASLAAQQLRAVRAALAQGEPAVCATVMRAVDKRLAMGARRVIHRTEDAVGLFGDARLDQTVVQEARRAMAEHYPQRLGFDPTTGAVKRLMSTRRADVEIFMDLYEPPRQLVIIGAGHIGAALARQGKFLNWHVHVVDDRSDFLTPQHLPDADVTHCVTYDRESESLGPLGLRITPAMAVVVATWGWDQPALRQLAGTPAFYVGLVASMRKATVLFDELRKEGIDPAWLDLVRVPIGLDVGAESPEEIALAIMAEILTTARGKSGRPLCEVRGARGAPLSVAAPAAVYGEAHAR